MKKGISKVMGPQFNNADKFSKMAVADFENVIRPKKAGQLKVLSYEQAITGNDMEMLGPMNRKTSPGYPWCVGNNDKGKSAWLGKGDEYIVDNPELKQACEELEEHCRNNQRGNVVFMAQLKDERRPHAKVDAGKTRVFEAAPMHFVLVFRKYFGAFIDHVMKPKERIMNEMCVGINPESIEWDRLARKLMSKGEEVTAGDFSNFDGSLGTAGS